MKTQQISLQKKGDERGSLVVLENNREVPFEIKRVYYLCDTKAGVRRGFHAHRSLQQMVICVRGSCDFLMDDGYNVEVVRLNNNHSGILVGPLIWREMFNFSPDCVLLVLASDYYVEEDYIRNYQEFTRAIKENAEQNNLQPKPGL